MFEALVMTVLRFENLSDVRLQKTVYETNQDSEQVIPATIAISCHSWHFLGISVFDMGGELLTMNDLDSQSRHALLCADCLTSDCKMQAAFSAVLSEQEG
jgi:hypothetical protein